MIEVNNLTNFTVDKNFFWGVAKKVLKSENKEITTAKNKIPLKAAKNLSIVFVSSAEIKKLNKKYRGEDKSTDVLSFGCVPCFMLHAPPEYLGEIVICPEVVKKNAKEFGVTFKKELAKMLIHGILHIFGYEHEASKVKAEKMNKKQDYYLSLI